MSLQKPATGEIHIRAAVAHLGTPEIIAQKVKEHGNELKGARLAY